MIRTQQKRDRFIWLGIAAGMVSLLHAFYDAYSPILLDVLASFMVFAAIYCAYTVCKGVAEDSKYPSWLLFLKALVICAFIAAIGAGGLGTYYEDSDPIFGGGRQVIDYIPKDVEVMHTFWKAFLILALSTGAGLHKGLEAREWSERIAVLKK